MKTRGGLLSQSSLSKGLVTIALLIIGSEMTLAQTRPACQAAFKTDFTMSPVSATASVSAPARAKSKLSSMSEEDLSGYLWSFLSERETNKSDVELLTELQDLLHETQTSAAEFFRNESAISQSSSGEAVIRQFQGLNDALLKSAKKLENAVSISPKTSLRILRSFGLASQRRINALSESIRTKQYTGQEALAKIREEQAICQNQKKSLFAQTDGLKLAAKKISFAEADLNDRIRSGNLPGFTQNQIQTLLLPALQKSRLEIEVLEKMGDGIESALNLRSAKLDEAETKFRMLTTVSIPNLALRANQKLNLNPEAPKASSKSPTPAVIIEDSQVSDETQEAFDKDKADAFLAMTKSPSWEVRREGYRHMFTLPGSAVLIKIYEGLADEPDGDVLNAADGLFAQRKLPKELITSIEATAAKAENWVFARMSLRLLSRLAADEVDSRLFTVAFYYLNRFDDEDVEKAATKVLQIYKPLRSDVDDLKVYLSSPRWRTRLAAARMLNRLHFAGMFGILQNAMDEETDPDVMRELKRAFKAHVNGTHK